MITINYYVDKAISTDQMNAALLTIEKMAKITGGDGPAGGGLPDPDGGNGDGPVIPPPNY